MSKTCIGDKMSPIKLSRRNFMKTLAAMGASAFLMNYKMEIVEALTEAKDYVHLCWLNGADCQGCSISFVQAVDPDLIEILTDILVGNSGLPLVLPDYMEVVHPASGSLAEKLKEERWMSAPLKILVCEGAVQEEGYCTVGGRDYTEVIKEAAEVADVIIAIGQCATFGGIPSGNPNPTGAMGVQEFLNKVGIKKTVINLPLCPVNPDHLVLTLAALIIGVKPELDQYGRPKVFFGKNMHQELCPYRPYYDRGIFKTRPDGEGCRFKMGCKGPGVWTDCALRKFNNHLSFCNETSICYGCSEPGWPDKFSPFFKEITSLPNILGWDATSIGQGLLAATAAGIVVHGVKRAVSKGKEEEKKE